MTTTNSRAFVPNDPNALFRELRNGFSAADNPDIRQAWGTSLQTSTGEKILRSFVHALELAQFSIARVHEERHMDTALLDSSIRALLRDMDVRCSRKTPAGVDVYISRSSADISTTRLIPALTTFTGGGKVMYNRYPITIPANERVVQARLYVGTIKLGSFVSTGEDFQEWLSPEDQFHVSDGRESINGIIYSDIIVACNGTPVQITETDQWWDMVKESDKKVKDRTTIDGKLQVVFGDDQYGYKPAAGSLVQIYYVVTNGASDNEGSFDSVIIVPSDTSITAYPITTGEGDNIVSSRLSGGSNEVGTDTYRKTGPLLFSTAGTVVRSKSANAWATNFPGVVDGLILNQAQSNPNDRRLMNVLKVCLLKGGKGINPNDYLLSAPEASAWLQQFSKVRPQTSGSVVFYPPSPSSPPLDLVMLCEPYVNLALAEATASQAIEDLFRYKTGSIRGTILKSELYDAIKYSTRGVTGVRSNNLTTDIVTYSRAPISYLGQDHTTGGILPLGDYTYYVVAICDVYNGTTLIEERSNPSIGIIINTNGTSNPSITFDPVVGAKRYEVYGRAIGNPRLAVLGANVYSFKDSSSVTPSTSVFLSFDSPTMFRFPKLGVLKLRASYKTSER